MPKNYGTDSAMQRTLIGVDDALERKRGRRCIRRHCSALLEARRSRRSGHKSTRMKIGVSEPSRRLLILCKSAAVRRPSSQKHTAASNGRHGMVPFEFGMGRGNRPMFRGTPNFQNHAPEATYYVVGSEMETLGTNRLTS